MAGTLEGIRILELSSYVTGPFASMLMADLGAEVIKVEDRERGDPFRGWGGGKMYSATFCSLNRNKKSITLDLRNEEGQEICRKLAAASDVLVENHRPGVMDRRGLGYDTLRALNPKIIYCSISGFGQEGPYRDRPGYDTVGQGMSGLLSLLTDPDDPKGMGISLSDHLTGVYACYGVLAALVNRMMTGEGQIIETSLLRASVSFTAENCARYFETGVVPSRADRTRTAGVFAFVDRDGRPFVVHLSSPNKFWLGLVKVAGKPEWGEDPRFAEKEGRTEHHDMLERELQTIFERDSRDVWLKKLREHDVPSTPLNNLEDMFNDPQVKQYGFPIEVEHPKMGKVKLVGSGVNMSRTPPETPTPPPMLGEDTDEVLQGLGYGADAIEGLRRRQVI